MRCIIMRGIAGSGKTTKAKEIVSRLGAIHSTNDFFIENGQFIYRTRLLEVNHHRNFCAFRYSIRKRVPEVVLDNCNHVVRHFQYYIDFAVDHGYKIEVIQMPHIDPTLAALRSPHNVPVVNIERMLANFEPYTP